MFSHRSATRLAALGFGTALLLALPAAAQQSGGVTAKGNTRIDAVAKDVNTIAIGSGNTAETYIGTIAKDTAGGKNIAVDVKNVENVVGGFNRKGCIAIGSAGACTNK